MDLISHCPPLALPFLKGSANGGLRAQRIQILARRLDEGVLRVRYRACPGDENYVHCLPALVSRHRAEPELDQVPCAICGFLEGQEVRGGLWGVPYVIQGQRKRHHLVPKPAGLQEKFSRSLVPHRALVSEQLADHKSRSRLVQREREYPSLSVVEKLIDDGLDRAEVFRDAAARSPPQLSQYGPQFPNGDTVAQRNPGNRL